ncbi:MAG TPA: hypothetical protein VMU39_08000 [Solirubrobacteraceae bacterium]|nr:hypothetical protein [Solirubrobacteraceae bacterium]
MAAASRHWIVGARRAAAVAVGLVALMVAPGSAAAVARWSAPVKIAASGEPLSLAFTRAGQGLFTSYPSATRAASRVLAASAADDRFAAVSPLIRGPAYVDEIAGGVAVYGRDRMLVVGGGLPGATSPTPDGRPWVAFGRIGRPLRTPRALVAHELDPYYGDNLNVALAANARGDAAAVVALCCTGSPLYLVLHQAGHRIGGPIKVTGNALGTGTWAYGVKPAVAVNAAGDVLVVWASRTTSTVSSTLYARILHAGRWRAPAQAIGEMLDTGSVSAQLLDGDRAVVMWVTQKASLGGGGSGPLAPAVFEAAAAGTNGRFRPAQTIDRGVAVPQPPEAGAFQYIPWGGAGASIATAVDATGHVRLAWTGAETDHLVVRTATLQHGAVGPVQTLGAGALFALTTTPRGGALALWLGSDRLMASTAPPNEPFAAGPENVAAGADVGAGASKGLAAVDPHTGRTIAVWQSSIPVTGESGTSWRSGPLYYAVRRPQTP